MKQSLAVVAVSFLLLSLRLPATVAKRAGGLPFSRSTRGQLQDSPPRGGGAVKPLYTPGRVPIELNPNYVPPPRLQAVRNPSKIFEETPAYKAVETSLSYEPTSVSAASAAAAATEYRAGSAVAWGSSPSTASWLDSLRAQFLSMYRSSPSLTAAMVSCVAIFLAWQVQPHASWLRNYFVVSRANLSVWKWPSVFLSALSHTDFWHLLVNLYGLWSFGPSVQRTLQQVGQPLGPFLGGAALASSAVFLALQKYNRSGGALGLSGVTLALLAVHARTHPKTILGVRLGGIIPLRLKAENMLICLTAWSFIGSFSRLRSDIAHAAHLGGLVFGMLYHHLVLQRPYRQRVWSYYQPQQ